jgi:hypothetical protein
MNILTRSLTTTGLSVSYRHFPDAESGKWKLRHDLALSEARLSAEMQNKFHIFTENPVIRMITVDVFA